MLPLVLSVSGRLALVVGAGPVGRRKARALIDAGTHVRVVDPTTAADGPELHHPDVTRLREPYHARHLDGVALAFAAATPAVNATVVTDARARGVWVNSASDPEQGDFFLPSTVRRGDLVISVSTGGAAPALSRRFRERLETVFDDHFAVWVGLLAELRPEVLARVPDPDHRRELFERLADWSWLDRLRAEGRDAVAAELRGMVEGYASR